MSISALPLPAEPPEPAFAGEAIALHSIRKSWQNTPVLDDLELTLERGRLTWIHGRNGIGKTTLLRIASGLIAPDSGVIDLDGLHPERDRREYQRRIGFLSAGDHGLYARLSVRRHVAFWAKMALIPRVDRSTIVERAIARFGLKELAERRVDRLSTGQRQRLRMAMAFLHEPEVLLLDEPVNSLDEEGQGLLRSAIREVKERGGAALWCSPGVEADPLDSDEILMLERGRLVAT